MRYNFVKPTVVLVICLLVTVNWRVPASGEDSQSAEDANSTLMAATASIPWQDGGYGPVIYAWGFGATGQQYEASAMRTSSTDLRVWTCGNAGGKDTIFFTQWNTDKPSEMSTHLLYAGPVYPPVSRSQSDLGDCSPSVVYFGSQVHMYFECAQDPLNPTVPNVCTATSPDGVNNWTYPPTRILTNNGGYLGHPSAVVNKDNQNEILLYVFDSTYVSTSSTSYTPCLGAHGIVWRGHLTADGSAVASYEATDLPFAATVKYFRQWGKYVATSLWNGSCTAPTTSPGSTPGWFSVFSSANGTHFTWVGGLLIPNSQIGQDPGQLIADNQGWIQSPNTYLQALIGAGPDRYNTQTNMVDFGLNLPTQ